MNKFISLEKMDALRKEYSKYSDEILQYNTMLINDDKKHCAICEYSGNSFCINKECTNFSGFIKKPCIRIMTFASFLERRSDFPKWLCFLIIAIDNIMNEIKKIWRAN